MPSHVNLFLLGAPRIKRDSESISVSRRKAIALVAYLAVTGNTHSRDTLATLLWPSFGQTKARAALRRALHQVKKALGDEWFDVSRETLTLERRDGLWLDVDQFHALLAQCEAHDHAPGESCPACLDALRQAVALYRDDFMAGFTLPDAPTFDEWQYFQTDGLRRKMTDALEQIVCTLSAQKELDPAIEYARRWLALDVLNESAHQHLIQLYALSGQRTAAMRQYDQCVQTLQQALGVAPQQETTHLYETIRDNQPVQPAAAPAPHPTPPPHNLPLQPTPFVGRTSELAKLGQLLDDPACRLLTLTGPGGVGKTRLALQAAAQRVGVSHEHIYYVPLESVRSADFLVYAIAKPFGFSFQASADPETQLINYLRGKETLLVLDNFEHLLEGTPLLAEILRHTQTARLLVTSRERLNLKWEWLLHIQGLSFPQDDPAAQDIESYDAAQLFIQCARRIRPDFELTDEQRPFLVRICRHLEGLPLGLELAAAWVEQFSCWEIARRLERDMGMLTSPSQHATERHHNLQATFDCSWELLSRQERNALARLSVFRGEFRETAAEHVAGVPPHILLSLMRKSFLQKAPDGRQRMLHVVRQYAEKKLRQQPKEWRELHDLHCAYYTRFLQQREPCLLGQNQKRALQQISRDMENVRAAWQWAVEQGNLEAIRKALESHFFIHETMGWIEQGRAAFDRAAAAVRALEPLPDEREENLRKLILGRLLARQGKFCQMLSRSDAAKQLVEESLVIFRSCDAQKDIAFALHALGINAWKMSRFTEADRLLRTSLSMYEELGDGRGKARSLVQLGSVADRMGQYAEAKQLLHKALALSREIGDRRQEASCLSYLGIIHRRLGEYTQARELYQASLAIRKEIGHQIGIARCLNNLGTVARLQKKYAEAERLYQESLTICRNLGDRLETARCLSNLGLVAEDLQEFDKAKRLHQESLDIATEIDHWWGVASRLGSLGFIHCALEEHPEAESCFRQALQMAIDLQTTPLMLKSLVGIAIILQAEGKDEAAVELATHALDHLATINEVKRRANTLITELEAGLPPQTFSAAQERGRATKLDEFVQTYGAKRVGQDSTSTPPASDHIIILIAEFQQAGSSMVDASQRIYHKLCDELEGVEEKIQIHQVPDTIESAQEAIALGKKHSATTIIWGYHDDVGVSANVEAVESSDNPFSMTLNRYHMSEALNLHLYIARDLPEDMTFLTSLSLFQAFALHGELHEALKCLARARDHIPDNPQFRSGSETVYVVQAIMHGLGSQLEEAIEQIDQAIEIDPHNELFYCLRGDAYYKLEKNDRQVWKDFERALALAPKHSLANLAKAYLLWQESSHRDALDILDRVTDREPDNLVIHLVRGIVNWELGNLEAASQAWERVQEIDPDDLTAPVWRGLICEKMGQAELAAARYARAREMGISPNHMIDCVHLAVGDRIPPCAYFYQGANYHQVQEKPEQALASFDRTLELDPQYTDALWKRGRVHAGQKDWGNAVADYTAAIDSDPGWPWFYFLRAQALMELDRTDEARRDLARALKLDPVDELHQQIAQLEKRA